MLKRYAEECGKGKRFKRIHLGGRNILLRAGMIHDAMIPLAVRFFCIGAIAYIHRPAQGILFLCLFYYPMLVRITFFLHSRLVQKIRICISMS